MVDYFCVYGVTGYFFEVIGKRLSVDAYMTFDIVNGQRGVKIFFDIGYDFCDDMIFVTVFIGAVSGDDAFRGDVVDIAWCWMSLKDAS